MTKTSSIDAQQLLCIRILPQERVCTKKPYKRLERKATGPMQTHPISQPMNGEYLQKFEKNGTKIRQFRKK